MMKEEINKKRETIIENTVEKEINKMMRKQEIDWVRKQKGLKKGERKQQKVLLFCLMEQEKRQDTKAVAVVNYKISKEEREPREIK